MHLGPELLEDARREAGVRAVRAVDAEPKSRQVGAEAFDHVSEIALRRVLEPLDRASVVGRRVQQRLDGLLVLVRELAPVSVEELHAVVLRRVVGRRDDGAQVFREQGHCRRGQHSGEDGGATGGDDAARERGLELGPGPTGIPSDEDTTRV